MGKGFYVHLHLNELKNLIWQYFQCLDLRTLINSFALSWWSWVWFCFPFGHAYLSEWRRLINWIMLNFVLLDEIAGKLPLFWKQKRVLEVIKIVKFLKIQAHSTIFILKWLQSNCRTLVFTERSSKLISSFEQKKQKNIAIKRLFH